MKCVFNFLFCKRRATPMLLPSRETAVLPRKIPIMNTSSSGTFYPNSLAVTGCLAVLLGLQYLRGKLSSKRRSVDQREESGDAQRGLDLDPLNLLGSDRNSSRSSGFLREERGGHALQVAKPAARSVPDLSSIVHAQVFGESNFRCISKLGGVDIAPIKRSRKSRRKMAKQAPPHKPVKAIDEIQRQSVPKETPGGNERETENSCVIVHPETSTGVPKTSHEEADSMNQVDSQKSEHEQSKSPSAKDKTPRRRRNRHPRPRHPTIAKKPSAEKPPQHALRRQQGNPGNCEDVEKMRKLLRVGVFLDQKESRTPAESQEISKDSPAKKHRRGRNPFHHDSGEGREQKTDGKYHDLGTDRGRKVAGQGEEPPRRQNKPKPGSSSRRRFPHNHSHRHNHQQSEKNRLGSSAMKSHRGPNHDAAVGGSNQLRDPKVVSSSEKTFRRYSQCDEYRVDAKPNLPGKSGYHLRKEYVDLDKPQ